MFVYSMYTQGLRCFRHSGP